MGPRSRSFLVSLLLALPHCGGDESPSATHSVGPPSGPGASSNPLSDAAGFGHDSRPEAGPHVDAGFDAEGDAMGSSPADAAMDSRDAALDIVVPTLDESATTREHGVLGYPDAAVYAICQVAITEPSGPASFPIVFGGSLGTTPSTMAEYSDSCASTGPRVPSVFCSVSNRSVDPLFVYARASFAFPPSTQPTGPNYARVTAFDSSRPEEASPALCIPPLSRAKIQSLGDAFGPVPAPFQAGRSSFWYRRTVTFFPQKPTTEPLIYESAGYLGGTYSSTLAMYRDSELLGPITEQLEGSGVADLPIRLGAGKTILLLLQARATGSPTGAALAVETRRVAE